MTHLFLRLLPALFAGAVLLGIVDPAQAQLGPNLTSANKQEGPSPLPEAESLRAGWWESLGLGTPKAQAQLARWVEQLRSVDHSELEPTSKAELEGLRNKLKEWRNDAQEESSERTLVAPTSLREMLELVEQREKARHAQDAAKAELGRIETIKKHTAQRRNEARNDYLNHGASQLTARRAQGWRWMRLWLSWKLLEKQGEKVQARQAKLADRIRRLDDFLEMPLERLVFSQQELNYWQERQKNQTGASKSGVVALDELPTVQELGRAISSQEKHLSSLVNDLAVELCSLQLTGAKPGRHKSSRPTLQSLRSWQTDARELIALRRDQVTRVAEHSASEEEQGSLDQVSEQFQGLSEINAQMQKLEIRIEQFALLERDARKRGGGFLDGVVEGWHQIVDFIDSTFHASLFTLNDYSVTLLDFVRFLAIVALAYGVSLGLRTLITRFEKTRGMPASLVFLLRRLIHYFVMSMGALLALTTMGIDLTKFAIFASALGVGLGLGFQSLAKNFVAGFVVLFERSLKIGDFIELESGTRGTVREINLRGTVITTPDNIDIMIPNSEFVDGKVINWTMRDKTCRLRIPFSVAYGTPKDATKAAVIGAATSLPFTITESPRHPQVWLSQFGNSSLCYTLIVWVEGDAATRPDAVVAAYNWAIETALTEAGIEIPFPQQELHLRSYFGLQEDTALSVLHPDRLHRKGPGPEKPPVDSNVDQIVPAGPISDNDAAEDTLEGMAQKRREAEEREAAESASDLEVVQTDTGKDLESSAPASSPLSQGSK